MLEYYLQLSVEVHRDAWTPLLLLILTRMLQLDDSQVSFILLASRCI